MRFLGQDLHRSSAPRSRYGIVLTLLLYVIFAYVLIQHLLGQARLCRRATTRKVPG